VISNRISPKFDDSKTDISGTILREMLGRRASLLGELGEPPQLAIEPTILNQIGIACVFCLSQDFKDLDIYLSIAKHSR
jgi:hypothetical protein